MFIVSKLINVKVYVLIKSGMQLDDREVFLRIHVIEPKHFEQFFVFVK